MDIPQMSSLPKENSIVESLEFMTDEEVNLNIIQISLSSISNEEIMKWLVKSMQRYEFYLQYRYLIHAVLNGSVDSDARKKIEEITSKFDTNYVNGPTHGIKEDQIIKNGFKKMKKCKFLERKDFFIEKLLELSEKLYHFGEDSEGRLEYFTQSIKELSNYLKNDDESDGEEESEEQRRFGKYSFYFKGKLCVAKCISQETTFFINTKNRCPLVIDFGFKRFLYKNDDQLSHELIAMQLIRYLNWILKKEYIKEYAIIPEAFGAFYEFIEDAQTVHQIKGKFENLSEYFKHLADGNEGVSCNLLKRFAQSYSGFCLAQYLFDIRDRNNGNIMIGKDGSIFHIDLAFIFGSSPGGISFESVPFKMTKEYVKLMGGFDSDTFKLYETLMIQHFTQIQAYRKEFLYKMQILVKKNKQIKCFKDYKVDTFLSKLPQNMGKTKKLVEDIIDNSYDSWKTNKYDNYQFKSNEIRK